MRLWVFFFPTFKNYLFKHTTFSKSTEQYKSLTLSTLQIANYYSFQSIQEAHRKDNWVGIGATTTQKGGAEASPKTRLPLEIRRKIATTDLSIWPHFLNSNGDLTLRFHEWSYFLLLDFVVYRKFKLKPSWGDDNLSPPSRLNSPLPLTVTGDPSQLWSHTHTHQPFTAWKLGRIYSLLDGNSRWNLTKLFSL